MRQSLLDCQRVNLKTYILLLNNLRTDLESSCNLTGSVIENTYSHSASNILLQRILPTLRNYSSWLTSNVHLSAFEATTSSHGRLIQQVWKVYADALNTLKSAFPISELKKAPSVDYLLEEDELTLGFKPIHNDFTRRRYCRAGADGLKPRQQRQGLCEKQLNDENIGRIRDFLTDGAYLVQLACSGVSRAPWASSTKLKSLVEYFNPSST